MIQSERVDAKGSLLGRFLNSHVYLDPLFSCISINAIRHLLPHYFVVKKFMEFYSQL